MTGEISAPKSRRLDAELGNEATAAVRDHNPAARGTFAGQNEPNSARPSPEIFETKPRLSV
jgi:hypothetical protein